MLGDLRPGRRGARPTRRRRRQLRNAVGGPVGARSTGSTRLSGAGGFSAARRGRIVLLRFLVASLLVTLLARLAFVQLLDTNKPQQSAGLTHLGTIAVPAPRGQILDSRGRVLVGNRSTHVLTVDRSALLSQADRGSAVLARLASLLRISAKDLAAEITPCGVKVPAPCWTGQPFQPVPVATDVATAVVLAVSEHAESYPGVAVTTQSVLSYPGGTLAAHVLGYTGAVSASDEKGNAALVDADTIGRSGLEQSYDGILRGVDGQTKVELDARGNPVRTSDTSTAAVPGDTLVTSIDADVQKLAEQSLANQIATSRKAGNPAPSGAVVVMDPHTGRVIAAASYPTYDPSQFVGGISVAAYQRLMDPSANAPLVGRAIAGQYAPGSTFKLVSLSDDVSSGAMNLTGTYPCPGSLNVDGRTKTNFDSESFGGAITPAFALQVSCDTFFYAPAVAEYYADQARIANGQKAQEQLQRMAAAFGVGSAPGVDLPADEQASGSLADRETRLARWKANRAEYCAEAKQGYPNELNLAVRAYLTQLASENCTDGWRYRAGDNADLSIGQGETTVSPLQLATAYSAMVNGGTLYAPSIGWGVVDASGKVVRTIKPRVVRKVPVSKQVLDFFGNSLHFQDSHSVSGALAFDGSPIKLQIGGKTGTAEVYNKKDTSWFASWGPVALGAPASSAKFVVVGMVEQAGLGSKAAAPMVRKVYEGLLGAYGPPVLPGVTPATTLPVVAPRQQTVVGRPSAVPSSSTAGGANR
ncbi:penicillin-binding transpeptidase domain-containing protein [Jatrophihabitans telluris]|uniref:Penicillin-binding transpeptidase domain-containing protein n=1 Tax=Jatrophihabitans telluris TaxID=2038343 RepID=A0ABY4R2A4_9ACTN|nr:penicillin-binding transpeptidase domain-containing protein [Jatrophihabitans telluris]UQX89672.1 penicillin-binding transpeptidase domain-containing protein [Jatrophihabitans telluris]